MNQIDEDIKNFRITRGAARYKLPWFRRVFMKLIGRSHLQAKRPYPNTGR